MENKKVNVISKVNHKVIVTIPEKNFRRTWGRRDAVVKIDFELLEELFNDIGFYNMLHMGILYIEDMEVKKELGLEPEDAEKPTNIIVLSEADKAKLLKTAGLVEFKTTLRTLPEEQIKELADYAIENRLTDMSKCKAIKDACGRDIIKAIQLMEDDKEEK